MHDLDSLSDAITRRMRSLPDEAAEPYGWEEFRQRAGRRSMPRHSLVLRMSLAAAALLVVAAGALVAWTRGEVSAPAGASTIAPEAGRTDRADPIESDAGSRNEAAERWLASQPASPAIVRVGAYAAIAGLEDRIAQLDDLMTDARAAGARPASLSALEQQRARLVSSLAQVRYAETLAAQSRR